MSAEETLQRDLDVAIAAARWLGRLGRAFARCADELDRAEVRRLRPALEGLYQGALDGLNHAIALTGYLDGFEARTALRTRLLAAAPPVPGRAAAPVLIDAIGLLGEQTAAALEAARGRVRAEVPAGHPSLPGPARTGQIAAKHLSELALGLPTLIVRLSATAGLQAQARIAREQAEADLAARASTPPR